MDFGFPDSRRANEQRMPSQGSSASVGQSSQHFEAVNASLPPLDLQNHQSLIQHPQIAHTQGQPSIALPSLVAPTLNGQPSQPTVQSPPNNVPPETSAVLIAKNSYKPEKRPSYKGFFALVTTIDSLIKYGGSIFEDVNQHFPIYAQVTVKPRKNASDIYFILDIIGQDRKLSDELYLAFGFTKSDTDFGISSTVCKAFFFKRYGQVSRASAYQQNFVYKVQGLEMGAFGFLRSKAVRILNSSFEEKAQAAFSRYFQWLCPDDYRDSATEGLATEASEGSTAGPSNLACTHVPGPADVHEKTSFWAGQDGQGPAFGTNASTSAMQGGWVFSMPMYATPTATSFPWYMNYIPNSGFLGSGTDVPTSGLGHQVGYQNTSGYANYDFTYPHIAATQAPFPDYNAQIPGPNWTYPLLDLDQTDDSQVAVSSHSDVPASGSSGQGLIQIQLEPASTPPPPPPPPRSLPPPSSIHTSAPPAPAKARFPRRTRPRKNKNKGNQSQQPHSDPIPQITSPERMHDPQETRIIHIPESGPSTTPVYNDIVTAGAQDHNALPGMSFSQDMSSFHYPPSYDAYQHGLVPQPSDFTYVSETASSDFDFGVDTFLPTQTQQPNSEIMHGVDGIDMDRPWWNDDIWNFSGGGFQ